MSKNRLGRGLSAILDDVEDAYRQDIQSDSTVIKDIALDEITPNIYQPRKHFDENALEELSRSLIKHGQLQPIVVIQKDDKYMIIAGERRFRAAKLAGFDTIKAVIADYENENLRELALIENIQRENLSPLELAQSYKELIEEYQITQEALGEIIHKSRSQITNTLRLLQLTPYTQSLLTQSKISQGHAKMLVGLDKDSEKLIADTIVGQKLSVRETEELIKNLKNPKENEKKVTTAKKYEEFDTLGEVVKKLDSFGIKASKSKNKIVISFTDNAQIKSFLSVLSRD